MTSRISTNNLHDAWALGLLTVLAFSTRIYGLGHWDFLVDEFATYYYADDRMFNIKNPAYYALVTWSFQLFGTNEFTARLPAMIFGVIAIPVFYWTWRHPLGRRAAFIGAVFIVLGSWHLWYSQYARFYSAVFLCGSLSFYFFWRAITTDDLFKLIWALLFNLLGVLFHFTAIMVPAACGAYLLLTLGIPRLRGDTYSLRISRIFLVVYVVGGLATIPLLLDLFATWQGKGQHWGYGPANFTLQLVKYIQVPISLAAFIGALILLKKRLVVGVLIASGIAVPGLALLLMSAVTAVRPDYFFYSLPLVYAAAGYLCATLIANNSRNALATHAMGIVLAASLLPEFISHYTGHRSLDVRETINYIESHLEQDDQVLAMVSGFSHYADDDIPLAYRPGSPYDASLDWEKILDQSIPSSGRLWIVAPAGRAPYASGFRKWLARNTSLVWRRYESRYDYTFRGFEIYRTSDAYPSESPAAIEPRPTSMAP